MYFVRLFITGFVLPVCWLLNILLYLYVCWWIPHDIIFPGVKADSSLQDPEKSADFTGAAKAALDRPSSEEPWDTSTVRDTLPADDTSRISPENAGQAHLKAIAASTIECHYRCRRIYLKWLARSLICIVGYAAAAIALVAVLSSQKAAAAAGNTLLTSP